MVILLNASTPVGPLTAQLIAGNVVGCLLLGAWLWPHHPEIRGARVIHSPTPFRYSLMTNIRRTAHASAPHASLTMDLMRPSQLFAAPRTIPARDLRPWFRRAATTLVAVAGRLRQLGATRRRPAATPPALRLPVPAA